MQEVMSKTEQTNGYYNLFGVYKKVEERTRRRLKGIYKKNYGFATFSKVIKSYLRFVFHRIITEGLTVRLTYGLGELCVRKIKCLEYIPKFLKFSKTGVEKKNININKTGGFLYFMYWRQPLKYVRYKMKLSRKYSKMIFNEINNGTDYLEYVSR